MPTNEERREVAAKLREKHYERQGMFEPQCIEIQASNRLYALLDCLPERRDMFLVLADLIEPHEHICLGCIKWTAIEGNPVKGICAEFSHPEDGFANATPYYGFCHEWEGE